MEQYSDHNGDDGVRELPAAIARVVREYSGQDDYLVGVSSAADARSERVSEALRLAFATAIRREELEVIDFETLNVMDLGRAIERYPIILKPILIICNVAGRALERDLDLRNIDTYGLKLGAEQAHRIAEYIKRFLPAALPLAALTHIDRVSFVDKEIRARKGQWERTILQALIRFSGLPFRKVKFRRGGQYFELDCAYLRDEQIVYGVDVKRIEARRDIHKRADEIVNKASKLKDIAPQARFGAVIYYPFAAEQGNLRDRLESPFIDSVQFAGESQQSVNQAVRLLIAKFGVAAQEDEA